MSCRSLVTLVTLLSLASQAYADVYMHNPRGSNNRNCNNSNNKARANANRLFDSQNNNNGGYSCPRAYPFDCYKYNDDDEEEARATCNAINTDLTEDQQESAVDEDGFLVHPDAINTPKMYYYANSILSVEWTNQHGSGANDKVHSDLIIQVACEDDEAGTFTMTDDCGSDAVGEVCYPRDGTPIHNQDTTNTATIPDDPDAQDNYRYGRHESYRFYEFCKNVERNKGLFTADQDLNSNKRDARFTRQNPNGARYGLECPEESEYYPWWAPSPWIDVAILTSDMDRCDKIAPESQNVKEKFYCSCPDCTGTGALPNNYRHCVEQGGTWESHPAWNTVYNGVTAPECVSAAFSRDNHLGNVAGNGQNYFYNWTIPDYLAGRKTCVLRLRYNISSSDFDHVSVNGDSTLNDDLSPIRDRDNNPEDVFYSIDNLCTTSNCKLGLAINSDQIGRTFQDRSYSFEVRERPSGSDCENIYNLNVRGKRGNIVDTYPAVEYDFVPNKLVITEDDCVHVQWTGSDYNPNRNPNSGEGGPPNPNNLNEGKTDRSNLVQVSEESGNYIISDATSFNIFNTDTATYRRLAFLDQDVEDADTCYTISTLRDVHENDNNAADRDHRNCMKLSGQKTPYFDAGLLKSNEGTYRYMSTRNNNFSNRSQKGMLMVQAGGLSSGAVAGVVMGSLLGAAGVAAALVFFVRPRMRRRAAARAQAAQASKPSPAAYTAPKLAGTASPGAALTVTAHALYEHTANESGELTFAAGDRITVLKQDASGWWEGRLDSGQVGVFPSNYVSLDSADRGAAIAV
ncbi:Protein DD3-3 [Hondaea fermentalgiana]|uniref:Protein DD3-3 n=1 Tax=Hondaea fermentalgiana TaxID=2315210 RepID=A0A2R5G3J4_9STRA|nr:Protein DD3-3 [Hondaea fermentalgiana]|eukprot:GBG24889.1 Protein DD3-3 [Hondaea fermentalgiana]